MDNIIVVIIKLYEKIRHQDVVNIDSELNDIIDFLNTNIKECHCEYDYAYSEDDYDHRSFEIITTDGMSVTSDYPPFDDDGLQLIMSFVDITKYRGESYPSYPMDNAIRLLGYPDKLIAYVDWIMFTCYDDEFDIDELINESVKRGYGESTMALIRWKKESFPSDDDLPAFRL